MGNEANLSSLASENASISKTTTILLNDYYKTPHTSLLVFHFDPKSYPSSETRLKNSTVQRHAIENQDVYVIRGFFTPEEARELTTFSSQATFSRTSYAHVESKDKGEEPAKSMDNQEKWLFFSKPPKTIQEVYKWLGLLAHKLDADVCTLPWDLCDGKITASAIATNRVETSSTENQECGKHQDYRTNVPLSFGIPVLYAPTTTYYTESFVNGDAGKPWLVTLMVYAAAPNFDKEFGMGTAFYTSTGNHSLTVPCENAQLVLFEGDILHSIAASHLQQGTKTWRVSYVYKLCFNPRSQQTNIKEAFRALAAPG